MLLSFSEPSMLPYVRAGIRQAWGDSVGNERVKRQTYRRRGPRSAKLLAHDPIGGTIPYDLDLYWKSRTAEGERLGAIACQMVRVYAVDFLHSSVKPVEGPEYQCIRITGPRHCWEGTQGVMFWSPGETANGFAREAYRDGFDSPEAFRDYFVPNMGDRF